MTPELFAPESVASESPKLCWLKRHGLHAARVPGRASGAESWTCTRTSDPSRWAATGATEEEACAAYALKHGLRLWNEEAGP